MIQRYALGATAAGKMLIEASSDGEWVRYQDLTLERSVTRANMQSLEEQITALTNTLKSERKARLKATRKGRR